MNLPRLSICVLLLALAGAAVAALMSGAPWLERAVPGGLPAGNAVAALLPVSLALLGWCIGRPRSLQRRAAATALVAALAWLPVSIALAGNLALDFSGERGTAWLGFSAVVMIAVLVALGWGVIDRLLAAWRRGL